MKLRITKRTRVKLGEKFRQNFNAKDYEGPSYGNFIFANLHIFKNVYEFKYSTRRNGFYYFKPLNEQKYSLFILKYGPYIVKN